MEQAVCGTKFSFFGECLKSNVGELEALGILDSISQMVTMTLKVLLSLKREELIRRVTYQKYEGNCISFRHR